MDKVKEIVHILMIQRFWVVSGVVTLVGIIFWWLASSELESQANEHKRKLDSAFVTATQVAGIPTHPNNFSHKKMEIAIGQTQASVTEAWQKQYVTQMQALIWPKRLEEDFERAVQNMRPVESIPFPTPLDKEISAQLRTRYSNYMHEVLPKLAEPIRAEWKPRGGSGTGGFGATTPAAAPPVPGDPAGRNAVEEDKYIVQWDANNQREIAARFDWSKQLGSVPQTLQILYAQEDFWVLESLMSIIAETNGDVDARYKAAIKTIDSIDLGANSARVSGQVYRVPVAGAPPAGPPPEPRVPTLNADGTLNDPAEYRYVDDKLLPVQAFRLRSAVNIQSTADAFLAVAKRLPVRLRLSMDIRKLNKLITECGNATLPLEVRQVRINRGPASTADVRNRGERGGPRGGPAVPGETKAIDPYLATVELFGIVYLYNPVPKSLQPTSPPGGPAIPAAVTASPVSAPNVNPGAG